MPLLICFVPSPWHMGLSNRNSIIHIQVPFDIKHLVFGKHVTQLLMRRQLHSNTKNTATLHESPSLFVNKNRISQVPHFLSSFSVASAFLLQMPTKRAFILSRRSLWYAFAAFSSSVTGMNSTVGLGFTMGSTDPRTWVTLAKSSGLESPTLDFLDHLGNTTNFAR